MLLAEASSAASHKLYCDEATSKATETSRPMFGSNLPNSKRPGQIHRSYSLLGTAGTGQRGLGEGKSGLVSSREPISRRRRIFGLFGNVTGRKHELVGLRITRLSSDLLSRGCLTHDHPDRKSFVLRVATLHLG